MSAHNFPQHASHIRRRDHDMTSRFGAMHQLLNEGHRLVDVLDYLNRHDAIELTFHRNPFDTSNKHFRSRCACDFCAFYRKFSPNATIKIWPGLVEEIAITAADL